MSAAMQRWCACWPMAGLRHQEALALQWRHVRERTLLVEQAATDGRLKAGQAFAVNRGAAMRDSWVGSFSSR